MADDQPWNIVKIPPIVQELVAGVQEPPSWYVVPEEDRSMAGSEMPEPIPIIDLSRLSASEEVAKLRSALENWGLFLVCCSLRGFFEQIVSQLRLLMDIFVGGWTWNGAKFSCRGYETGKRILQALTGREAEILKLGERKGVQNGRIRE
jgi:hypothetical protein